MGTTRRGIIIAGPTASGKSALGVAVAECFGGVVINADSMQVYDGLRVLTARPSPAEEARVPHRLFGVLDPSEACSAGLWLHMARAEIEHAFAEDKVPVVVGGTGLYLRALLEGLAPTPDVPEDVRAAARGLQREIGTRALFERLRRKDPATAARLDPDNTQRVVRAWEVLVATGRPLAQWQDEPPVGRVEADWLIVALLPAREALYAACDARLLRMMANGALDEVKGLLSRGLDANLPAMKALGVPELAAHVRGETERDEAVAAVQQATRNYAKRQLTWLRHQLTPNVKVYAQYSESLEEQVFPIIGRFLLTGESGESSLCPPDARDTPNGRGD